MTNHPESEVMLAPAAGDTVAFIVRIWYEAVDEGGAVQVWRGSVERVAGRQRLYFSDLDSIAAFIRRETGITPDLPAEL